MIRYGVIEGDDDDEEEDDDDICINLYQNTDVTWHCYKNLTNAL